ncbi:MAG TPA: galactose-1-phosphate uridylyltransferase [Abditibacteriaceae bacterium]|nr:galactose-1-phosphate uridylyltransferase [Abditibacteriaceae bacterium]
MTRPDWAATLRGVNAEKLPTCHMFKTPVAMPDGRTLTYYDFTTPHNPPPYLEQHQRAAREHPPPGPRVLPHPSELRWNPTLAEWTVYSAARMSRPMLPSKDACPLCPGILELPLPYQVAIFENRAPALSHVPGDVTLPSPQNVFELTAPGRGRCDLVVYSQQHDAKFAAMPVNDIYCLVEAWRDRYAELVNLPEVRYVAIFENKGREAGMTLDHPHGQIYGFPFLPPYVQRQWEQSTAFSGGGQGLWESVLAKEERDAVRIIAETPGFLAAQPFYARYPYEVHIWARRAGVASLLEMTPDERRQLAGLLKNITARYENLWPDAAYGFPTLMLMQQLSNLNGAENFRFHVEFYPLQRSRDKMKYRAAVESGTGTFLNDALPETQAAELRAALPHQVELPTVLFAD